MKGTKCHSGYAACEKCTEYGTWYITLPKKSGKVIYCGNAAPLRTDVAFDEMADEQHHSKPCPLKPFSVACVTQFGLDYMHLVCLGVVHRLLLYWKGPIGPIFVRLGSRSVKELSQKLIALCPYIPSEFARRPTVGLLVKSCAGKQLNFDSFCCTLGQLFWQKFCLKICIITFCCCQLASEFLLVPSSLQVFVIMQMSCLFSLCLKLKSFTVKKFMSTMSTV